MSNPENSRFLYGKNEIDGITAIERGDGYAVIYKSGQINPLRVTAEYWILYPVKKHFNSIQLDGDLHYKYATLFDTKAEWNIAKQERCDKHVIYDAVESYMVRSGSSYYRGMAPNDLCVLSFDIETTTLDPKHPAAKVLLISNTVRIKGKIERKLFDFREFNTQRSMIDAWCKYVRDTNPDLLIGHNIFAFDLPYLRELGDELPLGRNGHDAVFPRFVSRFRKDGSQSYDYNNVKVFGREIVDTFFLSIKYDVARNYPSYGLKAIITHEGLERPGRQHYDASLIHKNYHDLEEWKKIKEYCKDDADDSLALFDLMIPSFFYYAQSIPMSFQAIINRATGSQVNAFMCRCYLQDAHSLPQACEVERFKGGTVIDVPGIHKNVGKVDVASLYPSIIRQYQIYNKQKDPKAYFLRMVDLFTVERLKNKALANETGNRDFRDLEQAQKIVINSAYGFMGAPGLNFNSPDDASYVTAQGRKILQEGIDWAVQRGWEIVNADTDSFSFKTGEHIPESEFEQYIVELNSIFPDGIIWEHDGIYDTIIVVKGKNYILQKDGKYTVKGSGLKATMKEPALRLFIIHVIEMLLEGRVHDISDTYKHYVRLACSVSDDTIRDWSSKKTITKAVLNPTRTNEQRLKDAVERSGQAVQEGDKIHVFFKSDTEICLAEEFDGTYSREKLLDKLFRTIKVFETILDISIYPNYKLKRNKEMLGEIERERRSRIAY